jgi:hypothetical protein
MQSTTFVRNSFSPSGVWKVLGASCLALAACLGGASPSQAQGGPPYYSNDPGTPGDHQWEINVGSISLLTTGHSTARMPDLDINFGLRDTLQLTFEVGWLRDRVGQRPPQYGLSQDALGVKWRFYGNESGLAVSVFPQALINNPTRSAARAIVPPGDSLTLPVEIARHIGPIALNGELGYTLAHSAPNGWLAGIVAGHERRIRHRKSSIEFDAEFYAAGDVAGEVTQETVEGGLRLEIHAPLVLLAMAGRSVRQADRSFTGYLGLQLLLGPKSFRTPDDGRTPAAADQRFERREPERSRDD